MQELLFKLILLMSKYWTKSSGSLPSYAYSLWGSPFFINNNGFPADQSLLHPTSLSKLKSNTEVIVDRVVTYKKYSI